MGFVKMLGDFLVAGLFGVSVDGSLDGKYPHGASANGHDPCRHGAFLAAEEVESFRHFWIFCHQFFVVVDHLQMSRHKDVMPVHIHPIHGVPEGDPGPGQMLQSFFHFFQRLPGRRCDLFCTLLVSKGHMQGNFRLIGRKDGRQSIILRTKRNGLPAGSRFGSADLVRQIHDLLTVLSAVHIRPVQGKVKVF